MELVLEYERLIEEEVDRVSRLVISCQKALVNENYSPLLQTKCDTLLRYAHELNTLYTIRSKMKRVKRLVEACGKLEGTPSN